MDSSQLYITKCLFENSVYSLVGTWFEEFFTKIMKAKDNRFIQIKPQWSKWDRKNDGFIKEEWEYYQVYSPEDPLKADASWAKKALEDFEWLYKHWDDKCKIKKYVFVLNDKYKNTYPDISTALLEIEKKYNIKCKLLLCAELEEIFFSLDEKKINLVIGFIPCEKDIKLEYDALSKVISNLMSVEKNLEEKLVVPDFQDKIKFNWLTQPVEMYMLNWWYNIGSLENYYNQNNNKVLRVFIRDVLKKYYDDWKNEWKVWDDLYFYIVVRCHWDMNKLTKQLFDAIVILISYYFDTCDIFEEPILP